MVRSSGANRHCHIAGVEGGIVNRKTVVALLAIGYIALVLALFKVIKWGEGEIREAWYAQVTKRMVGKVSLLPQDSCILGIYKPELPYSFDGMRSLEDSLGMRFTLVSFYQAWGEGPENLFPSYLMSAIHRAGAVPVLTWEPWVTEFSRPGLKSSGTREHRYLKDIADGAYDFYIVPWAKEAVAWGKPLFLRFAHEVSNHQYPWSSQNGNRPEDYIRAWWRVHRLFDSLGASNVIWVWCPYKLEDLSSYPGDEYVDWTALDVFNYGDLLVDEGDLRWHSFDQLTSSLYQMLEPLRKPIMVAETGCSDLGGNRAVWYREMVAQLRQKYSGIKALVLFENPADRTSGRLQIDWCIAADPEALEAMREAVASNPFIYKNYYSDFLSHKKP
jgi:hypothetical protein